MTSETEQRESVIRAQMQERLDGELKMVIEKMAKDGLRAQEEVKRRSNARAQRLEEELETERSRGELKREQLEQRCEELADRIAGLSEDLALARREREAAQVRSAELEKRLAKARSVSLDFLLVDLFSFTAFERSERKQVDQKKIQTHAARLGQTLLELGAANLRRLSLAPRESEILA